MTVLDLLRRRAAKEQVKLAVQFETRRFSYADLEGGSNAAARVLRSCGVNRGDRVLLYADASIEFVLAYLGALKLGAIVVPANPAYRESDLGWILQNAAPSVVVTDRSGIARASALAPPSVRSLLEIERGEGERGPKTKTVYPFYQALKKTSVHPVDEIVEDQDPALIVYTSGTTGRSKGALLTHGNLAANAVALHDAFGWTAADRLLLALPLFHVHGLCVGLNGSLAIGGEIVLHERFDPNAVLAAIKSERCSMLFAVPTMISRILAAAPPAKLRSDLASLRLLVSGSAPLPADQKDAFERATGHRIAERYGMSETLITLAQRADSPRPSGFVGYPVNGIEVRIVDSDHHPAKAGEPGELLVRGNSVGPGYYENAAATEASRHDGWFQTGDLALSDPASGQFKIVGRAREMILTGGLNVYPREVEEALESHPAVAEVAVIGSPDPDLGESVLAVVVLRPGASATESDLVEHCKGRIASYKKPKSIRFISSLPRNAMGKIVKSEISL